MCHHKDTSLRLLKLHHTEMPLLKLSNTVGNWLKLRHWYIVYAKHPAAIQEGNSCGFTDDKLRDKVS